MSILRNRWLTLGASLGLGIFFVVASYHKIDDPPDFAKSVCNFKLLPPEAINPVAIYLPWFEALAGAAVVAGFLRRGAAFGLGLLLVLFIAALSFNLYRGHPTICGCFSTYAQEKALTPEQKFAKMRSEIALDAGLFLLAMQAYLGSCPRLRASRVKVGESEVSETN